MLQFAGVYLNADRSVSGNWVSPVFCARLLMGVNAIRQKKAAIFFKNW